MIRAVPETAGGWLIHGCAWIALAAVWTALLPPALLARAVIRALRRGGGRA